MALELEAVSEEEMKVEDCRRFFRPYRCISCTFTRLRFLAEGAVAVAAANSEAEGGCVPRGALVGREVISGMVCRHRHIGYVWRSGDDAVICILYAHLNQRDSIFCR